MTVGQKFQIFTYKVFIVTTQEVHCHGWICTGFSSVLILYLKKGHKMDICFLCRKNNNDDDYNIALQLVVFNNIITALRT